MYVKIKLAKRFSRFCCSLLVCDSVDVPTGVGKRNKD